MIANWKPIRAYEEIGGCVHSAFEHDGKIYCFRYEPTQTEG